MSGLRVIAGSAKGRKLARVPGDSTRPITDRVKEALFNILGQDIVDASFFDLFAGTGSVGIEALSRGASYSLFTDNDNFAIKTVRANLTVTRLADRAEVLKRDAFEYLESEPSRRFDYVYIAPPQYKGMWQKSLDLLDTRTDWLEEDGWVIAQVDPKEGRDIKALTNFVEIDRRRYGNTLLIFFALK